MGPSAPEYPDDDTVSIRTYASTPPPFPDDGKNDSARNNSFSYMVDNIQWMNIFLRCSTDFDLPTYEEALLLNEEIDVNLQSIEYSFAQLQVKSTTK